ncbi:MAG TPA: DUF4232 domain-containing protein [Jatrophihabitans sp.]|nr:DUF4232 domain-containing protein [Jatrophihabitans sp.]
MARIRALLLVLTLLAAALVRGGVAASAAPAAAAQCGDASLAVTATRSQGATGHGSFVVLFQNISGVRCHIRGYPGLDAIGRNGHLLKHAKRTLSGFTGGSRHGVPRVVLRPGRFASADVEWLNFGRGGRSCKSSLSVNATPANTGYTVHLARSVTLCHLQVHPTVPGRSGNLP